MDSNSRFAPKKTAVLVLADGSVFFGTGFGKIGQTVGEVCFNTAITGYQEILTDPSYNQQIVVFTAPHIGNTGTNDEDEEASSQQGQKGAIGLITKAIPTLPSNWRNQKDLDLWLERRGIVGIAGIDTRAITHKIRENGMPHGTICYSPDGKFDIDALKKAAIDWAGLEGADLAKDVSSHEKFEANQTIWQWPQGFGENKAPEFKTVVMDFGTKANILRDLAQIGAQTIVVPAITGPEEILALKPDGVLLSNGPGDPAATGEYVVPSIRAIIDAGIPVFGICLGHQMLGIALGGKTVKMKQGHHGANHPVKDLRTSKVEIVSMNHGFALDAETLPTDVMPTHVSLFDGSNCGIAHTKKPVFSVQYHPEASPGPKDSFYLFEEFAALMRANKK